MPDVNFIHLRTHSAYSLSEGAIKVKELVKLCVEQGMPAVGLTDSDNLFGAMEFSLEAVNAGVQPIIGCQLGVARVDAQANSNGMSATAPAPDQIVLLAATEEGYRNLLKLVSKAYLETEAGGEPHVLLDDLELRGTGLIALTGGPKGTVGRLLEEQQDKLAEEVLSRLSKCFPGNLYVELQRHGLTVETAIEERLIALAYAHDLPLVATNEPFFATADLYEAHDALLCIAEGVTVNHEQRRRVTPEHRFKSAEEMAALFADLPEALQNTVVIAQRCSFYPKTIAPILPAYETAAGRSESDELRAQAESGLAEYLETRVLPLFESEDEKRRAEIQYKERLAHELGTITQMGFPGYFLIVADFIQWAKNREIPVGPGRGSGAGSLVAWSLKITDLDPIRWNLLFERFLNPERVSMPDFDIDFCQDRRDEVIQYVQEKYGRDRVAQIITFGKLQARAVLRDVGRVLQMPYGQVDRICKLVPNNPANPVTLGQAIAGEPELQFQRDNDQTVGRLIDIALKLEGLYRHASTHAAGVVIGDRPLDELVPLYRDPRSDMPVTQFNMKYVEQAGLVKFDFLGLKTLTVLTRAVALVREREADFNLETVPLDDAEAYRVMARGDTVGVFQLESSGMRDALRKLKPDRFEDVVAMVSLYRPGPMENIPSYIKRKAGDETPDYLYPTLEPILVETYGIMIYQEQVMQIAQELAGYSLGGADLLRRAMGKKIASEMDAQREIFVSGAGAKGVPKGTASAIFDLVAKFAGYGFNKSHAAAYALVAYQTAYMKANHPVEFLAASMTYDMTNTDKLGGYRQELDRLRIRLLPPDVNRSDPDFAVEEDEEGKAIRYALAALKNVGRGAMTELSVERRERGVFTSLSDFAQRLDPRQINKRTIENLATSGAFDSLEPNRHAVFQAAETVMRHAATAADERISDQVSLFGGGEDSQAGELKLPKVIDWSGMERLQREFDAIGFYLSAHPLDGYEALLARKQVIAYADLRKTPFKGEPRKRLAGIVVGKQERTSKKGSRFAFVQMSDSSGQFEVMVFAEVLAQSRELLDSGRPLLVEAALDDRGGGGGAEESDLRLLAQRFEDLEASLAKTAAGLRIYADTPEPLPQLQKLLEREGQGQSPVCLVLSLTRGEEAEIDLPQTYNLPQAARQAIKAIPGLHVTDL
ncbi:DNA polymerase III subunit alpha [Algihabitans albus]|uniref:DNA polymerase III subunit alpha n=1 Tax=Algihabitans albus TaxID=2164067 RepID=UPI000E5C83F0|nr:DNA polymerase III subunit alpha [Algihabitans albus]